MPPSMTPGSSIIVMVQSPMPTWPSPRSERLGTPKIPAIRFTRGTYFGASRFTDATACQVARPPLTDRNRSPRPQRAFTSRLPAVWSPFLPLGITTTWTGLLMLAGLAPAGMAASLAAPEPDVPNSGIRLPPRMFDGKALAVCRTRSSPGDTLARRGVRCVPAWPAFPLAPALGSIGSPSGCPAAFADFPATMAGPDFSRPCIIGFGPPAFPMRTRDPWIDGQSRDLPVPVQGASVHAGVFDHAGPG